MQAVVAKFLKHTVTVQRQSAPNAYGEYSYLPEEQHKALKMLKQQAILDPQGQQTRSDTEVWMMEELQIGDLIDGVAIQARANRPWIDGKIIRWDYFL